MKDFMYKYQEAVKTTEGANNLTLHPNSWLLFDIIDFLVNLPSNHCN